MGWEERDGNGIPRGVHFDPAVTDKEDKNAAAWAKFCRRARKELTPAEAAAVSHSMLHQLFRAYDTPAVEAAKVELHWQKLNARTLTDPPEPDLAESEPPGAANTSFVGPSLAATPPNSLHATMVLAEGDTAGINGHAAVAALGAALQDLSESFPAPASPIPRPSRMSRDESCRTPSPQAEDDAGCVPAPGPAPAPVPTTASVPQSTPCNTPVVGGVAAARRFPAVRHGGVEDNIPLAVTSPPQELVELSSTGEYGTPVLPPGRAAAAWHATPCNTPVVPATTTTTRQASATSPLADLNTGGLAVALSSLIARLAAAAAPTGDGAHLRALLSPGTLQNTPCNSPLVPQLRPADGVSEAQLQAAVAADGARLLAHLSPGPLQNTPCNSPLVAQPRAADGVSEAELQAAVAADGAHLRAHLSPSTLQNTPCNTPLAPQRAAGGVSEAQLHAAAAADGAHIRAHLSPATLQNTPCNSPLVSQPRAAGVSEAQLHAAAAADGARLRAHLSSTLQNTPCNTPLAPQRAAGGVSEAQLQAAMAADGVHLRAHLSPGAMQNTPCNSPLVSQPRAAGVSEAELQAAVAADGAHLRAHLSPSTLQNTPCNTPLAPQRAAGGVSEAQLHAAAAADGAATGDVVQAVPCNTPVLNGGEAGFPTPVRQAAAAGELRKHVARQLAGVASSPQSPAVSGDLAPSVLPAGVRHALQVHAKIGGALPQSRTAAATPPQSTPCNTPAHPGGSGGGSAFDAAAVMALQSALARQDAPPQTAPHRPTPCNTPVTAAPPKPKHPLPFNIPSAATRAVPPAVRRALQHTVGAVDPEQAAPQATPCNTPAPAEAPPRSPSPGAEEAHGRRGACRDPRALAPRRLSMSPSPSREGDMGGDGCGSPERRWRLQRAPRQPMRSPVRKDRLGGEDEVWKGGDAWSRLCAAVRHMTTSEGLAASPWEFVDGLLGTYGFDASERRSVHASWEGLQQASAGDLFLVPLLRQYGTPDEECVRILAGWRALPDSDAPASPAPVMSPAQQGFLAQVVTYCSLPEAQRGTVLFGDPSANDSVATLQPTPCSTPAKPWGAPPRDVLTPSAAVPTPCNTPAVPGRPSAFPAPSERAASPPQATPCNTPAPAQGEGDLQRLLGGAVQATPEGRVVTLSEGDFHRLLEGVAQGAAAAAAASLQATPCNSPAAASLQAPVPVGQGGAAAVSPPHATPCNTPAVAQSPVHEHAASGPLLRLLESAAALASVVSPPGTPAPVVGRSSFAEAELLRVLEGLVVGQAAAAAAPPQATPCNTPAVPALRKVSATPPLPRATLSSPDAAPGPSPTLLGEADMQRLLELKVEERQWPAPPRPSSTATEPQEDFAAEEGGRPLRKKLSGFFSKALRRGRRERAGASPSAPTEQAPQVSFEDITIADLAGVPQAALEEALQGCQSEGVGPVETELLRQAWFAVNGGAPAPLSPELLERGEEDVVQDTPPRSPSPPAALADTRAAAVESASPERPRAMDERGTTPCNTPVVAPPPTATARAWGDKDMASTVPQATPCNTPAASLTSPAGRPIPASIAGPTLQAALARAGGGGPHAPPASHGPPCNTPTAATSAPLPHAAALPLALQRQLQELARALPVGGRAPQGHVPPLQATPCNTPGLTSPTGACGFDAVDADGVAAALGGPTPCNTPLLGDAARDAALRAVEWVQRGIARLAAEAEEGQQDAAQLDARARRAVLLHQVRNQPLVRLPSTPELAADSPSDLPSLSFGSDLDATAVTAGFGVTPCNTPAVASPPATRTVDTTSAELAASVQWALARAAAAQPLSSTPGPAPARARAAELEAEDAACPQPHAALPEKRSLRARAARLDLHIPAPLRALVKNDAGVRCEEQIIQTAPPPPPLATDEEATTTPLGITVLRLHSPRSKCQGLRMLESALTGTGEALAEVATAADGAAVYGVKEVADLTPRSKDAMQRLLEAAIQEINEAEDGV